jgi:hypothetical protein
MNTLEELERRAEEAAQLPGEPCVLDGRFLVVRDLIAHLRQSATAPAQDASARIAELEAWQASCREWKGRAERAEKSEEDLKSCVQDWARQYHEKREALAVSEKGLAGVKETLFTRDLEAAEGRTQMAKLQRDLSASEAREAALREEAAALEEELGKTRLEWASAKDMRAWDKRQHEAELSRLRASQPAGLVPEVTVRYGNVFSCDVLVDDYVLVTCDEPIASRLATSLRAWLAVVPNVSFEEAWRLKEAEGYQYGQDALEQVRLGWEMRGNAKLWPTATPPAAPVTREAALAWAKEGAPSPSVLAWQPMPAVTSRLMREETERLAAEWLDGHGGPWRGSIEDRTLADLLLRIAAEARRAALEENAKWDAINHSTLAEVRASALREAITTAENHANNDCGMGAKIVAALRTLATPAPAAKEGST